MTAKPVINLSGSQGNAFYLLGMCEKFSRTLGKDSDAIQAEMMKGDYDNLLAVFRREFGKHVVIIDPADDVEYEDEEDLISETDQGKKPSATRSSIEKAVDNKRSVPGNSSSSNVQRQDDTLQTTTFVSLGSSINESSSSGCYSDSGSSSDCSSSGGE